MKSFLATDSQIYYFDVYTAPNAVLNSPNNDSFKAHNSFTVTVSDVCHAI